MTTPEEARENALRDATMYAEQGDWCMAQGFVNLICCMDSLSQEELDTLSEILQNGYETKKREKNAAMICRREAIAKRKKDVVMKRIAADKKRRLNLAKKVLDIVKNKN